MRLPLAIAGAGVSSVLYALAFPPASVHALGWVALVPLFVAARGVGVPAAALLGFVWAELVGFQLVDALPQGVSRYFDRSLWVGVGFSAFAFGINGGLQHALALAVFRALARHHRVLLPVFAGCTWVGAELARAFFQDTLGPPSGQAAYTQSGWSVVIQVASWTGLYGISFVVVATNAALAELWLAWRQREGARPAAAGLAIALVAIAFTVGFGVRELASARSEASGAPGVPVAVIQGNLDPTHRWSPERYGQHLEEYLGLTRLASREADFDLVVWPEAALTFHLLEDAPFREWIAETLRPLGVQLVTGGPRATPGEPPAYFNSVFLVSGSGETLGHYDKQFLLPFAEYDPMKRFGLGASESGPFRYWQSGAPTPLLETAAGPAGVFVCNEAMHPEVAAERAHRGAAFLISPTNDGWLGGGWTPWPKWGRLMLDVTALRAVEQRRYVVRASTSGPSAIIDAWGRVRAVTEPGVAAVLVGSVRPRNGTTVYAQVGDAFAVACLIFGVAGLAFRPGLFTRSRP